MFRDAWLVAGKDLRIELRSRIGINQILPFALLVLVLFAFALDPDTGVLDRATPGLYWVAVLFCAVLAIQRAFAVEAADGNRDALRLSGLDPAGIYLGKMAAIAAQLAVLEVLLGIGVVVLYTSHATGWLLLVTTCVAATRRDRCGRYPLRRSRRRTPRPGNALAVAAPAGALTGAHRLGEGVRSRTKRHPRRWLAVGRFARRVRSCLHHLRGLRVRPPPGGIVTSVPTATEPSAPHAEATAAGPIGTGSRGTRILGAITLLGLGLAAYLALVSSPQDENMGDVVRILYIHVPIVTMAYVACAITTGASVMVLWKKTTWWDVTAATAAELGTVFTALTLVIGMIWAKPTWGVWWVWDARLTSTAMLLLFLIGYLAVRRIPADPDTRARRSAIIGLLLLPNVFIVNRSVTWWRSLHQGTTILNTLQPKIHDQMAFTLVFSIGVCALVFAWLFIHRWRLTWLEEQVEVHELDEALIERRAEAGADGAGAGDGGPR